MWIFSSTKKTSLARRNALLSVSGVPWGAAVLLFAGAALLLRLFAPNAFLTVITPALSAGNAVSARVGALVSGFSNAAALTAENRALAEQNAALAAENRALTEKANTFAALLGTVAKPAPGVVAGVLARPPQSPYDTLILSGGTRDGIEAGMEAFAEGGVPVGVVSQVSRDAARITLFSSPSSVIDGWVGSKKIPVALSGAGAGALRALIPRAAAVREGDVVFVPGPGMLPVGTVLRLDGDPSSPTVTLRVAPAVNPFSLSWLLLRAGGVPHGTATTSAL